MLSIDLARVIEIGVDWFRWKEEDPILANEEWLALAKEGGILDADRAYGWSKPEKVEARLAGKSHEVAYVFNKKTRTKQRVIGLSGSVLMMRTPWLKGQ